MNTHFARFWWTYVAIMSADVLLIVGYLTDFAIDLVWTFKIPIALMSIILLDFHLRHRLRVTAATWLFAVFGASAAVIGLLRGTLFSDGSLTHVYMTLTPVAAVSIGYAFAAKYSDEGRRLIHNVLTVLFGLTVLVLSYYYYHYYITERIPYFGFDSRLPLVSALFLVEGRLAVYFGTVVLVLLSGKRAPLVSLLSGLLVWLRPPGWRLNAKVVLTALLVGAVVIGGVTAAYQAGLLYRFTGVFELDLQDYDQVYLATSGRSDELIGLFETLRAEPWRALTGSGIGGTYEVHSYFPVETIYSKHYLHFGVLTYVLVYGLPFLFLLLSYVARILWINRQLTSNFYYLALVVLSVGSMFGATIIVEPVFWFFLGVNVFMARHSGRVADLQIGRPF